MLHLLRRLDGLWQLPPPVLIGKDGGGLARGLVRVAQRLRRVFSFTKVKSEGVEVELRPLPVQLLERLSNLPVQEAPPPPGDPFVEHLAQPRLRELGGVLSRALHLTDQLAPV